MNTNSNFITLWVNNNPFVTILQPFDTFKAAAKKASDYVRYNTTNNNLSFTINTPLTREIAKCN